jgi:hypothetical protein
MTLTEFREKLEAWWADADSRAVASKDSQRALLELIRLYESFDPSERKLADQVIAEWIGSASERKHYDALAMADRFRMRSAVEPLRKAEAELLGSSEHSAKYELAKVRRILEGIGD